MAEASLAPTMEAVIMDIVLRDPILNLPHGNGKLAIGFFNKDSAEDLPVSDSARHNKISSLTCIAPYALGIFKISR